MNPLYYHLPETFVRIPLRHATAFHSALSPGPVGKHDGARVDGLMQYAPQSGHRPDCPVIQEELSVLLWIDLGAYNTCCHFNGPDV